jgi:hypothetical protein
MPDSNPFVGDNDHGNTLPTSATSTCWIVVLSDGETYSAPEGAQLMQITLQDADRLAGGELVDRLLPLRQIPLTEVLP